MFSHISLILAEERAKDMRCAAARSAMREPTAAGRSSGQAVH